MLASVEGVYRNGKIELVEIPKEVTKDTAVIVTFLTTTERVDLHQRRIDPDMAAEIRSRLAAFSEDWDAPEMDIYDRYESVKDEL